MIQNLKVIRKKADIHAANGFIIDSLDGNSTKDAPSIRAVNEKLAKISTAKFETSDFINGKQLKTDYHGMTGNGGIDVVSFNGKTIQSSILPTLEKPQPLYSPAKYGGCKVVKCGKNLCEAFYNGSTADKWATALRVFAPLKPATTYTVSFIGANNHKIYFNEFIFEKTSPRPVCNGQRQTYTLKTNADFFTSSGYLDYNADGWVLVKNDDGNTIMPSFSEVQIVLGTDTSAYEPYDGVTTVLPNDYGFRSLPSGVCDTYSNGTLTTNVAELVINGSEVNWTHESSTGVNQFSMPIADLKNRGLATNLMCDRFKVITASGKAQKYNTIYTTDTGIALNVDTSVATTVEDWKTWLSTHAVTIAYELKTARVEVVQFPTIRTKEGCEHIISDIPLTCIFHSNDVAAVQNMYQQNLLVNGDFQVNQRGQDTYTNTQSRTLTVDMWAISETGAKLTVKNDGVELSSTNGSVVAFYQRVFRPYLNNKYVTTLINVNGVDYYIHNKVTESGKLQRVGSLPLHHKISYSKDENVLKFTFTTSSRTPLKIKYVCLFEGNAECLHLKETHEEALMRCQRYLFRTVDGLMCFTNDKWISGFTFPCEMAADPTYRVILFSDVAGNDKKNEIVKYSGTKKGVKHIELNAPSATVYQMTLEFSCE